MSAGCPSLPVVVGAFAAACQTGAFSQPCGQIPDGGCPKSRGGTCEDRSCAAIYVCYDGRWEEQQICSTGGTGGSAGHSVGGGGGGGGSPGGAGGCTPASIDHAGEVEGCDPDLVEAPDCPVEVAESCHPCLTGCEDFFLCMEGGWYLVAYCNEDAQVVVQQP